MYITNEFYCMNCGTKGIPLPRNYAKQREKGHRKSMYCLNCRLIVNHLECKTQEEVEEFKFKFSEGEYKDEAFESIQWEREHPHLSDVCDGWACGLR